MRSRKKSMMRAPSSVFWRTISAMVGGLRSTIVSVMGTYVSYIGAIMWEDRVVVKREISPQRTQRAQRWERNWGNGEWNV